MKKEIKIGIFARIMLASLWAGLRFLSGVDSFGRYNTYYAQYDRVNGLAEASPVLIQGYKVGTISKIKFDPTKSEEVQVAFRIRRRYALPANSEAKIFTNGLMGGKAVEIILGDSPHILENGATIKSSADKDLMDFADLDIDAMKTKLVSIIDGLESTLSNVNNLLETNTENLNATMTHINSITGSLDGVLSGEAQNIRSIIKNIDKLTTALGNSAGKVESIASNADKFTTTLAEADLKGMIASLDNMVTSLDGIIANVSKGDGTIGKLMNDQQLYNNLTLTASNLSSLLYDMKQNPKRYIHVSVFGKKVKDDPATQSIIEIDSITTQRIVVE